MLYNETISREFNIEDVLNVSFIFSTFLTSFEYKLDKVLHEWIDG